MAIWNRKAAESDSAPESPWATMSDDDLGRSMELAAEAASDARQSGNTAREAAFHKDLNNQLDEAERRGWRR